MIFENRLQAGELLVPRLKKYENNPDAIVLGLPRGGVVTAFAVARGLHLPLDVICLRKLGAPFNPELAIGAVGPTGETFLNESLINYLGISEDYIEDVKQRECGVAKMRLNLYRKGKGALDLENKTVILIDDGLATGATMHAAIATVKAEGAGRIVVAVPVAPPDTIEEMRNEVDEVICLHAPLFFQAVGQFYQDFAQTEDSEVIDLLQKAMSEKRTKGP